MCSQRSVLRTDRGVFVPIAPLGRLTRSAYREHASGDTIKSGVQLYRMHASPIRGPVSACSSVDRLHRFVGAVVLAARGTTR